MRGDANKVAQASDRLGEAFRGYLDRLSIRYGDYPCYGGRRRRDTVVRTDADKLARFLYTDASICLPWKRELALED